MTRITQRPAAGKALKIATRRIPAHIAGVLLSESNFFDRLPHPDFRDLIHCRLRRPTDPESPIPS